MVASGAEMKPDLLPAKHLDRWLEIKLAVFAAIISPFPQF